MDSVPYVYTEVPYVYTEFHDGSFVRIAKRDLATAEKQVATDQADPSVNLSLVFFDAPGKNAIGDSYDQPLLAPGSMAHDVELDEVSSRRLSAFFMDAAVRPTMTTAFDTVPDGEKGFLDYLSDASTNAEEAYLWLRDPLSWNRNWRRVAMVTFPFAFVVWVLCLAVLLAFAHVLDLTVRVVQFADMSIGSFDEWWNRADDAATPAYVLKTDGPRLDSATVVGVRQK